MIGADKLLIAAGVFIAGTAVGTAGAYKWVMKDFDALQIKHDALIANYRAISTTLKDERDRMAEQAREAQAEIDRIAASKPAFRTRIVRVCNPGAGDRSGGASRSNPDTGGISAAAAAQTDIDRVWGQCSRLIAIVKRAAQTRAPITIKD